MVYIFFESPHETIYHMSLLREREWERICLKLENRPSVRNTCPIYILWPHDGS